MGDGGANSGFHQRSPRTGSDGSVGRMERPKFRLGDSALQTCFGENDLNIGKSRSNSTWNEGMARGIFRSSATALIGE